MHVEVAAVDVEAEAFLKLRLEARDRRDAVVVLRRGGRGGRERGGGEEAPHVS